MTDFDPKQQKEIFKEAIKEWMDEKYAEIGKWTVRVLTTAVLTGLFWAYIQSKGFKWP